MSNDYCQFPRRYDVPEPSRTYGLGIPDVILAEELQLLKSVLRSGRLGWCKNVEEWIEWNTHPVNRDECLKIVADYEREAATS